MSPFSAWISDKPIYIIWRGADKSPIDPLHADVTSDYARSNAQDSRTWLPYDVAAEYARVLGPGYGVGVMLHDGCGLFCVDIDGCVVDGRLSDFATQMVAQATGAYVELSMSGRGVHIIGPYRGTPPLHSTKNKQHHVELYSRARYIALTGRMIAQPSPAADLTDYLLAIAWSYFQPSALADTPAAWTTEQDAACPFTGTDDERIAALRKTRSFAARLSPGKVTFNDLWAANADKLGAVWPGNNGQPYDASSADQAFANHLAWQFGNNCEAIDRIMQRTDCPLYRAKWEREDYRRATILKAVAVPKRWRTAAAPSALGPVPPPPAAVIPAPPLSSVPPPPAVDLMPDAVPESLYRCTDQANAQRLQQMYRHALIAVAADFYAWDGKRWKLDDGLAQRFACDLSRMVTHERNEAMNEFRVLQAQAADGVGEKLAKLEDEIKALGSWAAKCEMQSTQNAALGLLRKLLNVPVECIDANPWLLNVANGTIDLRTGTLSPHNPADLITKLAPIPYDPAAKAPRFTQFLNEIFQHDAAVVDFTQRWYGYAATGDAREQKLLIKHGPGGNGKSTLGDAIDAVLGEYASPATLGLLTGKQGSGDTAHLAEIADLRGRRLVSASESEDGAKLKEALLKQLTGGDSLKGKRLYGQLFAFKPTHKLELLTNHKPVIKGSDFSIWRRIMLLSFPVKYGSAAEVAAGEAMAVRDPTLPATLRAEAPGILAWVVAGTALWLSMGLAAPKAVLDASAQYRQQQDHVAEFLTECCRLDPDAKMPLKQLYASYKAWCHDAGRDYPMTRQRLVDELERRVPRFLRPSLAGRGTGGLSLVGGVTLAG